MVRHQMLCPGKPEQRYLREDLPFEWDRVRQHDVESRQAIGRYDQQMLRIDVVDITHLALVNLLQAAETRLKKGCRLRNLLHACAACRLLPLRSRRPAIVAGQDG